MSSTNETKSTMQVELSSTEMNVLVNLIVEELKRVRDTNVSFLPEAKVELNILGAIAKKLADTLEAQ